MHCYFQNSRASQSPKLSQISKYFIFDHPAPYKTGGRVGEMCGSERRPIIVAQGGSLTFQIFCSVWNAQCVKCGYLQDASHLTAVSKARTGSQKRRQSVQYDRQTIKRHFLAVKQFLSHVLHDEFLSCRRWSTVSIR